MANSLSDLSILFHALADPTRRETVARLAEGPLPVSELAKPTGLKLPTVMRHLGVLEDAGVVVSTKEGRVRTCRLVPEALEPARSWMDEQRATWEATLGRLDDFVMTTMKDDSK